MLTNVEKIIKEIAGASATNDKIAILKANFEDEFLQQILYYTYYTELKYGFTMAQLSKKSDGRKSKWNDIFEMLDELASSNINNDLRNEVLAFIEDHEQHRELFSRMLTKDFKNGVKIKTINKVWSNLIPVFDVQKPEAMSKLKLKKDESFGLFLKENGARGTYYAGKMMTRQGKEHKHMHHIVEALEKVFGTKYVIDGELIRDNIDNIPDNENFRLTISILNQDEWIPEKETIVFRIFDMVPQSEFDNGTCQGKFLTDRLPLMKQYQESIIANNVNSLSFCQELYIGNDQSEIQKWLDWADTNDKEGLCLYKDDTYKKKKTTSVIKIKTFLYSDVKIIGWFEGEIGTKLENKFGGFIIDYKGYPVRVGGGYEDTDRELFGVNPESYIGRILEVKYKSESKNNEGGISILYPNFICLREKGKEVSYES